MFDRDLLKGLNMDENFFSKCNSGFKQNHIEQML